ncbi:MAG UNVERIFIED_CONTAM: tRNA (adenosine(37)-N6)-threonylcarbamoyltransferase complex ATPase subunit type 1 TsaE [Rickettsiaceae bacterium]|jgi:tRNA threonylcarbamoyladenosine biosynthesis protein TsaE
MRFEQDISLEEESIALARKLAYQLSKGDILALRGDLGAGKTFIARHIIQTIIGTDEVVASPTFQLLQIYKAKTHTIYHYDLYRLKALEELYELGFDDAMNGQNIVIIEWPEIARGAISKSAIDIEIILSGKSRTCIIHDFTDRLSI